VSARVGASRPAETVSPERWISRSVAETERAGETLAAALRAGDVIALEGPLGAGKTRVVAGLARGLGCVAAVRSPTFTLINEYHGRLVLAHADLYRVDEDEVETLGLEDALEGGVLAVEWGEKLPPRWLAEALILDLAIPSAGERAIGAAAGPGRGRGAELLLAWRSAVRASGSRAG
jgi:tRNA threonylcarbamoyl adenosine modification protein YjeE